MLKLVSALQLLATRPRWVIERAGGYAEMAGRQAGVAARLLRRQAWLLALTLVCVVAGVVLAGVSLMLWAVVTPSPSAQPWLLLVTPAVPLLAAALCFAIAQRQDVAAAVAPLTTRWAADRDLIAAAPGPAGAMGWAAMCAMLASAWLDANARRPA